MTPDEAEAKDLPGNLVDAASAYEAALASDQRNLWILVNLTVLYWQATDFGVASSEKVSIEFQSRAEKRYAELIELMQRAHANAPEARFGRSTFHGRKPASILPPNSAVKSSACDLSIWTHGCSSL